MTIISQGNQWCYKLWIDVSKIYELYKTNKCTKFGRFLGYFDGDKLLIDLDAYNKNYWKECIVILTM